ncbi:hypothetical protein EV189_1783 [Motilibacter rhizosphaerae]|uniref:VanZ like protein n=1 Tax=Motilibacter rhizosphaerae TaxID=598652 RepID=A0A4Q7NSD0_9ACTN|nr:VanZ family protein [Motilibacter rhizosphaerae]RZS90001.1 hypothetical protein EV189_1783 [Motilibacter rhizosphaerae]
MLRARPLLLAGFALAVAVQLVAVYAPRAPSEGGVPYVDKVVHLTIFAAPALLGLLAGLPARWLLPVLVVHAPVSELLQALVLPHRDGGWDDALADLVGVGVGWWAARRGVRRSGARGSGWRATSTVGEPRSRER